jgi:hypothetical protein
VGLILPLLVYMAIGLSEIGFLAIDYLTVTNAARSGARTGAAAATTTGADDLILNVVEEDACNLRFGDLQNVTIYKAKADGTIPSPPGSSVNVYVNSGSLACDTAAHGLSCSNGCPWTPASRDRIPPTFDQIGVKITFTHQGVTGLFPFPTVTWTESAVMQVEPDTKGSQ